MRARIIRQLSSPRGVLALAITVGLAGGLGAVGFRYLIEGVTLAFSGRADPSVAGGAANPHIPWLGHWYVLLTPVIGGLVYGPIVARWAPEARGHGVPEVMAAVAERGGRIRPQVPIVKSLASAVTIGSGGSVGREGPIVQIGSAIGSVLGQALRLGPERTRLLVACGAAAGISATFNAPIAGVFFALEVILRDFETQAFGAVVLASVTAAAFSRSLFGADAFLTLPAFGVGNPLELVAYALLGLLAAAVGVAFTRVLYGAEDVADRLWRGPQWARPAAGGLLLGLVLLVLPEMYGVGYPVLTGAVAGHYAAAFLLVLLLGKVLATSLTLAIGGSGGVFAPSLFMGAMLGAAFGTAVHGIFPGAAPAGAFAVVGMGAVFAGATRAPITGVIIIFELTGDYALILPLMLAVVLATALSARLSADTIYTLKLRRRGLTVDHPRVASVMQTVRVREAVTTVAPGPAASDAEDPGLVLDADDTLEHAIALLARTDQPGLPVRAGDQTVGWVTHRTILLTYERHRRRLRDGSVDAVADPAAWPPPASGALARERRR